jgi:hypothetical protein
MSNNTRVFNLTRRFFMKHKQACRAVENCACAWVEPGVSLRDLTLAEAITARNAQAALRDPLPFAELPGVMYRPSAGREVGGYRQRELAREANRFAQA